MLGFQKAGNCAREKMSIKCKREFNKSPNSYFALFLITNLKINSFELI